MRRGRGYWIRLISLLVVLCIILNVTLMTHQDQARYVRLTQHGVPVNVRVLSCIGNLGGSGSTSAGYTCTVTYQASGRNYRVTLQDQAVFEKTGSTVAAVADPANATYVITRAGLPTVRTHAPWVVLGVLGLVAAALALSLRPRRRL